MTAKKTRRITTSWPDAKGKDVKPKAAVKYDGKAYTVRGRFTKHASDGALVPSVALDPKGHKGKSIHAPAKAVVHS